MKILHYFLGFPPYRTGGLTKYAFDLMRAQVEDGHTIIALWPGRMRIFNQSTIIKRRRDISGIKNYELINPLPVSLDEGITEFDAYMKQCDSTIYEVFLKTVKPNVVHIHTLMGIHKEFIDVTQKLNIRTVFTTHDYYGICPKVTLYRYGKACEEDHECIDCIRCNCSALSLKKILIMQSPLYRVLKNSHLVRKLRKRHRGDFFANEEMAETSMSHDEIEELAKSYRRLRTYYVNMLEKIDMIHFNSSLTKEIYGRYMTPKDSVVVTITHSNISDNRVNRNIDFCKKIEKLRITFLAPAKPFKGFGVLKQALDELWEGGKRDFELKLFGSVQNPSPYMVIEEKGFNQGDLPRIFADTDVLVAPSIWYETFGFTVLEAISYGVPVIVSNHVGAKDIIGNAGIIIEAGNVETLKNVIREKSFECISEDAIDNVKIKRWTEFLEENYNLYDRK